MEQMFKGTIIKKLYHPPLKKAKYIIEVLESENNNYVGKKFYLITNFDLPIAFRHGVKIRFYGSYEKLGKKPCIIVTNASNIKIDTTRSSMEKMKRHKILINGYKEAKLITTKPEDVNIATDIAGIAEIINLIGYDYDKAVEIYDTLQYRVKRRGFSSITEAIEKNPLIIQQVKGIDYSKAHELKKKLNIAAQDYELELYAAASAIVWKEAQSGESFVPLRNLALKLKSVHDNYFPKNEYIKHSDLINVIKQIPQTPAGNIFGWIYFRNFGKNSELRNYRYGCYVDADRKDPDKDALTDMMAVYAAKVYNSEKKAAELLASHISSKPESASFSNKIISQITNWASLDPKQQEAITAAVKYPFCIWIGAAGTGKTHTIKMLAKAVLSAEYNVVLLSPTAVAANRLSEGIASGVEGMTVHRYAHISEKDSDYLEREFTPEEGKKEEISQKRFVIVDEVVMLDICAFSHLMHNLTSDDHLILCGDLYQLPAVGPSGFIHQLCKINLPQIPVVELEIPHRHNEREKREIYELANSIRHGELTVPTNAQSVFFRNGTKKEIITLVRQLYNEGIKKEDVMVIVPSKVKGELCADNLNSIMQKEFNPDNSFIPGTTFKIGDPVINIRNDYYSPSQCEGEKQKVKHELDRHEMRKENIYNGYRGIIVDANEKEMIVEYLTSSGPKREPYTLSEALLWLELAYAITIHKSQGGEADHVIIAEGKNMDRQMLYTAVTRAKKKLYLMFSEEEAKNAVSRVRPEPRSGFITKLAASIPSSADPEEVVII